MSNATKHDYEVGLRGLDFPTSKAAVLNRARDNGGIDREVTLILAQLPNRSFESMEDLISDIRAIYIAHGESQGGLPV